MKKYLILLLLSCSLRSFTQITPGSLAADFTVQDISGNSHSLYSQLDSGKTVVIHCFAAWDSYAWEYYEQQELEAFNSLYGTAGNATVAVWRMECETQNTFSQLQGPASLTGNNATDTQGDWLSLSSLPLIDDSTLAVQFDLTYLPVLIIICPDRVVRFADQLSVGNLANLVFQNSCPPVLQGFDPALISATTSRSCGSNTINVQVVLKNLGTDTLFNADIALSGATPSQTISWEGQLTSYQSDTISLSELEIVLDGFLQLAINDANINTSNDSLSVRSNVGLSTQLIKLELALDAYPDEVTWEIRDDSDSILYNGGGYQVDYQYVSNVFQLPASGCYNFFLRDNRGDGLHGSQYGGFDGFCKLYSMTDSTTVEEEMFHYDGSYNFSTIDNSPAFLQYTFEAGSAIGVNELESNWIAYPVPASHTLNVHTTESLMDADFVLCDLTGRPVASQQNFNGQGKIEFDVSSLPSGFYILSMESSHRSENFTIIVQH